MSREIKRLQKRKRRRSRGNTAPPVIIFPIVMFLISLAIFCLLIYSLSACRISLDRVL